MSNSVSAMNLGLQGIQRGMNGLNQNAHQIANAKSSTDTSAEAAKPNTGVNDLTDSLDNMKLNKLQVEMSAKVVQTSSDMIGTLLDIKA